MNISTLVEDTGILKDFLLAKLNACSSTLCSSRNHLENTLNNYKDFSRRLRHPRISFPLLIAQCFLSLLISLARPEKQFGLLVVTSLSVFTELINWGLT